jgi:hypothetical protein
MGGGWKNKCSANIHEIHLSASKKKIIKQIYFTRGRPLERKGLKNVVASSKRWFWGFKSSSPLPIDLILKYKNVKQFRISIIVLLHMARRGDGINRSIITSEFFRSTENCIIILHTLSQRHSLRRNIFSFIQHWFWVAFI